MGGREDEMKKRKVYSFNSELHKVTGVQKVLLDIHHSVKDEYDAYIVGLKPFSEINDNHGISENEYIRWKNPFLFYNSIVILHERKFLMLFWLLNHLLFQRIKLVYVHHNMLYGHRLMCRFPKTVVCISDRGRQNLTEYFKVPEEHIHKIHNCVRGKGYKEHQGRRDDVVKLLYPARINSTKRQIEIVRRLRGKLNNGIEILFAGDGPDLEEFRKEVENDEQFVCLGFQNDVIGLMRNCDFVLLFSEHEGLPITLIEAAMTWTPIICNDVGGNTEICENRVNGIIVNEWDELIRTLNSLENISDDQYNSMSKAGRKIYEERFTFERFKSSYLELLRSLM